MPALIHRKEGGSSAGSISMLKEGNSRPAFSLEGQDGKLHTRDDVHGKWLVLYFYPKDNTSGCTLEAQNFASRFAAFEKSGAVLAGVSADSIKSHASFATKNTLPFILLSDPDHSFLEACGVWQKKKMAGHEYMGIVRSTLLVDPAGTVRAVWTKVKVPGHVDEVLDTLQKLQKA